MSYLTKFVDAHLQEYIMVSIMFTIAYSTIAHKIYRIVQNFRGTQLLWLGHHVSICGKIFMFASKQRPQVPKHFEIRGKTFAVQTKTAKFTKVLALKHFVLHGT